jgi:hypothetical protein
MCILNPPLHETSHWLTRCFYLAVNSTVGEFMRESARNPAVEARLSLIHLLATQKTSVMKGFNPSHVQGQVYLALQDNVTRAARSLVTLAAQERLQRPLLLLLPARGALEAASWITSPGSSSWSRGWSVTHMQLGSDCGSWQVSPSHH